MAKAAPIPVTILTGFLGSGKTTLLNHLLTQNHGRRIAIVENEFGEVGVDNALVVGATEEIVEMNNGCLCCTVREDLVSALGKLLTRRDRFDYVIIETSGLADPGPVMTTFLLDEAMQAGFQVDAIVTVVDAAHLRQHLGSSPECSRQIGFADVILLNKTDLVPPADLDALERDIRAVNRFATLHRTVRGAVPPSRIVGLRAFDLANKQAFDGALFAEDPPFSWAARFQLAAGDHELLFASDPHDHQGIALLPLNGPRDDAFIAAQAEATALFDGDPVRRTPGETLAPMPFKQRLAIGPGPTRYPLLIPRDGWYGLFAGHDMGPYAFSLLRDGTAISPTSVRTWEDDGSHAGAATPPSAHRHDATVKSVGILERRPVDGDLLSTWLGTLLQHRGADIYRMKGVFNVAGSTHRFIFQGVHMLFEGKADRPWRAGEERLSQFVFIGRNLDRSELERGFRSCLAFTT